MKYIFIILTIAITSCTAQTRFPQRTVNSADTFQPNFNYLNGDYVRDNENKLNVFEGTWVYNDGAGTIFTLQLQKKEQVLCETTNSNNYRFSDMLILTYSLVKNNVTLFDNLIQPLPDRILKTSEGAFGYFDLYDNNDFSKLWGSFHDEIYNILADCTIIKINTATGQPQRISFDLYSAMRRNDPSFYQSLTQTFGVPDNVELIKQ